jgi:hypothetical protein
MTMETSHLDDDTLSASLDGALEDAAGQSHLAGCAGCSARRDQLEAARSALATAPVEPVDELTRRRLVATALDEAGLATRPRAWYQRPALAGGVAAAVLALLVAVPFVTGDRPSSDTNGAASAGLEVAGGEFLGDLGDLSDPAALRERFAAQRPLALTDAAQAGGGADTAGGTGSASAPKAAAPPHAPVAGSATAETPAVPSPQPASDAAAESYAQNNRTARDEADSAGLDRTVAEACARTLAGGPARGSNLLAVATGTYQGNPAVVAVFSDEEGTTAFVAARDGCRLLTRYQV